jgi:hypothetical protein
VRGLIRVQTNMRPLITRLNSGFPLCFFGFEEELEIPMPSLAELILLVSPGVRDFLAGRISRATSEYLLRY